MIKGFIFDLDGVITETASLHYESWKEELKKQFGIDYTIESNMQLKGLPRMDTLIGILKLYDIKNVSKEKMEEMATNKNNSYLKKLETSISKKDILPGIEQLIIKASEKGIKLAIASSSFNAPLILEKIGLKKYFPFIVNPGSISKGKPAPDIYLEAAKGINIEPTECVGFEDAMPGVEGLQSANIPTIAITHGDSGDWNKAQMVVESTSELTLEKILEKFN